MQTQRKKIILAALAVVLPAIVLVLLLGRFLRQQSELEGLRRAAATEQAARDIGGSMAIRLDLLALEHLGRHWENPEGAFRPASPASMIFDDTGDGAQLPWKVRFKPDPELESARRLEARGQLDEAELRYRRLNQSGSPETRAAATLGLARVLERMGTPEASKRQWEALLDLPLGIVDDLSIPYAFYAARTLGKWSTPSNGFVDGAALSPTAVAMLKDGLIADRRALPDALEAWSADAVWGQRVASNWGDLLFRLEARPDEWALLEGRLTRAFESPDGRRSVVAIHAEPVFKQAADGLGLEGSQLAEAGTAISPFPGLAAEIALPETRIGVSDGRFAPLMVLLAFVLPLAAGLLLWREMRRDRRLAATRANFVASVSHEMRTPLTTIGVFGESLLNGWTTSEEQKTEYLETIVAESARLGRLIGNVLDLSAIERGVRSYRMESVDLRVPVQAACRAVQVAAAGKEIHLECSASSVKARADKDALEQAVINLLGNAVKFSPRGSRVSVRVKEAGEEARIMVKDQGPGISLADRPRIFDTFYRASDAESVAGAGIGLSVTRHIAESHGGRIEVESESGKGSVFTMVLPLHSA